MVGVGWSVVGGGWSVVGAVRTKQPTYWDTCKWLMARGGVRCGWGVGVVGGAVRSARETLVLLTDNTIDMDSRIITLTELKNIDSTPDHPMIFWTGMWSQNRDHLPVRIQEPQGDTDSYCPGCGPKTETIFWPPLSGPQSKPV